MSLLLLILLCSLSAFGQGQESVPNSDFNLFDASTAEAAEKEYKEVTEGTLLSIDLAELKALRESAPDQFSLTIPLKDKKSLKLKLERIQVFTNDFKVETSRRSSVPDLDLGVHYRGTLAGYPTSMVSLSIYENKLIGLISNGKNGYELVQIKDHDTRYIVYKIADLEQRIKESLFRFQCFTESSGQNLPKYTEEQLFGSNRAPSDCKVVQVYLVSDFSYYQVNGSDLQLVTEELTAVFAQTINIYRAESIYMVNSGIFVWEEEDTFDESADADVQRDQFRDYYNSTGAGWPGDLAQLISGYFGTGGGGIAYFDGLCTSDSYALTRAGNNSAILPWTNYSRFVKVLTHEIGHNLNSRHTHACVWNGDDTQIDDYGNISVSTMMPVTDEDGNPNPEGGACLSEPYKLSVTPRIMSYFDSNGWGQFNMTNGMGTQSGNVMRNYVANSSCLSNGSTIPPIALCQDVTVQLDANGNGSTTASAVDDDSYDSCGNPPSLSLSQTSFGCGDVGDNIELLTVTDPFGQIDVCSATVTVEDNVAPNAVCQNVTVQLDASGNGSTSANAVNNGSSDACGISGTSLSQTHFDCSELGANFETLTVTDVNGNIASCNTTVTVEDNIAPTAFCLNTTVEIQPDGTYDLQLSDVYDAVNSFDNCAITQTNFPATTYTCDDVYQTFPVTVTISDISGNTDDCVANIYVEIGTALPAGWFGNDVGQVTIGNDYTYDPCAGPTGEFTITGSGNNGIGTTTDNVAFASQSLCGNGTITAKLESVTPNGYGGLMVRETTAAGSKQVAIFSNLTNILQHESRQITNGVKQVQAFYRPNPFWLRLQRQGDWIFAYYSTSGASFSYVHAVYVPMQSCVEIGLASYTYWPNQQTAAVFGQVSVVNAAPLIGSGGVPAAKQHDEQQTKASLFPNPANSQFTLLFPQELPGEATASLRNQVGQVLQQRQLQAGDLTTEWDVSELPAGLYFMEVRQEDQPPQVLRVVKQ